MNSRGLTAGSLPVLILFVGALVFGGLTLQISEAISSEVKRTFDDLDRVSSIESSTDTQVHDYLSTAAEQSVYNQTYELAEQAGGVKWTSEQTDLETTMHVLANKRVVEHFNRTYGLDKLDRGCKLESSDYDIVFPNRNVIQDRSDVYGSMNITGEGANSSCDFSSGKVSTDPPAGELFSFYEATWDRYFELAHGAAGYFQRLERVWDSIRDPRSYRDSGGSCTSRSTFERRARDDYERELEKGIATSSAPVLDVGLDKRLLGFDTHVSSYRCWCSNPCRFGGCCGYTSTATVELDEARSNLYLRDRRNRVPVESGWEQMRFAVDVYYHDFGRGTFSPCPGPGGCSTAGTNVDGVGTIYPDISIGEDLVEYAENNQIYLKEEQPGR